MSGKICFTALTRCSVTEGVGFRVGRGEKGYTFEGTGCNGVAKGNIFPWPSNARTVTVYNIIPRALFYACLVAVTKASQLWNCNPFCVCACMCAYAQNIHLVSFNSISLFFLCLILASFPLQSDDRIFRRLNTRKKRIQTLVRFWFSFRMKYLNILLYGNVKGIRECRKWRRENSKYFLLRFRKNQ